MLNREEFLARAHEPSRDAIRLYPFYRDKIETVPKCVICDFLDFAIWHTPSVAAPCRAIEAYKGRSTNCHCVRWHARPGTGQHWPRSRIARDGGAALPFKYLGGVDVGPLCLMTEPADGIINTVKLIQPSIGGINLDGIQ